MNNEMNMEMKSKKNRIKDLKRIRPKLENAFDFAQIQVDRLVSDFPDYFPMYTVDGKWKHEGETWTNWCEGFLGGMMWIFYARNGAEPWRERAEHYSQLLKERRYDRNVHDLGFLFWSTWQRWYDLTGDPAINQVVITAGQTMGLRFMKKGGYLRSFVAPESLFIDIMMNIGIVFYAALQTQDQELLFYAHQHCLTTRRYLVRGDGSTAHEGIFNPETGEFLRQSTHQGWRGDSVWARGQAWALYGFGTVYRMTGNPVYLQTAQICADFFIANTDFRKEAPGGPGIPPNDFDDPSSSTVYESSAAAIAASGLLDLSRMTPFPRSADRFRSAALAILDTLSGPQYLAKHTTGWQGILKNGVYHQRKGLGVNESVMWGDYFFVEALDKALSLEE